MLEVPILFLIHLIQEQIVTKSKEEMTLTERIRFNNPAHRRPGETELARKARAGELPLKAKITERKLQDEADKRS